MATVPSLERSLSQLLSPSQAQRLVGGGQINPMDLTQTRGSSQAPALGTGTPLGNMAGAVPFTGGAPGVAGVMPQGFSPGGLQMPQGIGLLPLGISGGFGGQEGRPTFFGFDQSPARREAPQAQPQQMPSRQEPINPNGTMQGLLASAQGASRAAQPASGGIDFEAISRFFQSGGPQSRAILGPGGFNQFAGNISTIFNPVQSAISRGAQSILSLLKGGRGNTAPPSPGGLPGRVVQVPSGGNPFDALKGGSKLNKFPSRVGNSQEPIFDVLTKGVMPQGFEEIVQDMLSKYISGENVPILPESSLGVPIPYITHDGNVVIRK